MNRWLCLIFVAICAFAAMANTLYFATRHARHRARISAGDRGADGLLSDEILTKLRAQKRAAYRIERGMVAYGLHNGVGRALPAATAAAAATGDALDAAAPRTHCANLYAKLSHSAQHTFHRIAYLIPFNGMQAGRVQSAQRLVQCLLESGVLRTAIVVADDDSARRAPRRSHGYPGGWRDAREADADVALFGAWLRALGVPRIRTNVSRAEAESGERFGLHLSAHMRAAFGAVFESAHSTSMHSQSFEYAALLEDDILLAPDAVAFYAECAAALRASDERLVACSGWHAAGHFVATAPATCATDADARTTAAAAVSANSYEVGNVGDERAFAVRRVDGFIAPGALLSKAVYEDVVRPLWLTLNTTQPRLEEWVQRRCNLRDNNWDSLFRCAFSEGDVIVPLVSRVHHGGGVGYTVMGDRQLTLYEPMQLSQWLPAAHESYPAFAPQVEYDVYKQRVLNFVRSVDAVIHDPQQLRQWHALPRHSRLLVSIPGNQLLHHALGDILKLSRSHLPQRSVKPVQWKETLFLQWMTNTVLFISQDSFVFPLLNDLLPESSSELQHDLHPVFIAQTNASESCTQACARYSAVCDDTRMPLANNCEDLRAHYNCDECREARFPEWKDERARWRPLDELYNDAERPLEIYLAPGSYVDDKRECLLAEERFLRCDTRPPAFLRRPFSRLCSCVKTDEDDENKYVT